MESADADIYARILKKVGDPQEAARLTAKYRERTTAPVAPKSSAPAGGPKGTQTGPTVTPAPVVEAPEVESVAIRHMASPRAAERLSEQEDAARVPKTMLGKAARGVREGAKAANKLDHDLPTVGEMIGDIPAGLDYAFGSGWVYGLPGSDWRGKRAAASTRAIAKEKARDEAAWKRSAPGRAALAEAAADIKLGLFPDGGTATDPVSDPAPKTPIAVRYTKPTVAAPPKVAVPQDDDATITRYKSQLVEIGLDADDVAGMDRASVIAKMAMPEVRAALRAE